MMHAALGYLVCGVIHELAHLGAAAIAGQSIPWNSWDLWIGVLFDRRVNIDESSRFIRHAGWIVSLLLAALLQKKKKEWKWVAGVTAIEAIATDLLRLPVRYGDALFCGNFGIILLHQAWLRDQGQGALDLLETMVRVTMMRGAQSGGVITFTDKGGIRSRVVNRKRTDLSKLVRKNIKQDAFAKKNTTSKFFCGHTRFATSSMASLPGTHPQQWTPPQTWRVYDLNVPHNSHMEYKASPRVVENYITHNGDFDYYCHDGKTYDLDVVQNWLSIVTKIPTPALVDSCAVAGMVDVLRTQGSFGLSARYAAALALPTCRLQSSMSFPERQHFEKVGAVFEEVLTEVLKNDVFESLRDTLQKRDSLAMRVASKLNARKELMDPLTMVTDDEGPANIYAFCKATINAFFDNDLFFTTKTFLKNARGSFGLCFTSSLDAQRQICLASRGQTMSVAFYPDKGLICYGSEQAAVKAGMSIKFPGDDDYADRSRGEIDDNAQRLDLDDLGGEIVCLDWGHALYKSPALSKPNEKLLAFSMVNGSLNVYSFKESKGSSQDPQILHRMTRLTHNRFIKPLPEETKDLVLSDINDIPRICHNIQADWHSYRAASSLNRLTAFTLSTCLRDRLERHAQGHLSERSIDILVTGCEVSLWLGEQFAADLKKCFPRLNVQAISSNKILGLFGQEIPVPALGFPYSAKTHDLHDTIVIIVSHSGGTFAPLSCSNLLQSATRNIFVVTSEWDTQIGKQLRAIDAMDDHQDLFTNRVFTTECGMRPAEPCSLTVAATQQLLTNIFLYISAVILGESKFLRLTGATLTEVDLQTLERCNRENIDALTEIVGYNKFGYELGLVNANRVENELRMAGDIWAEHILEIARAYIMSIIYIFVTVTAGYPLLYAIAYGAGLDESSDWYYLIRAFDSLIYIWLPQINVLLLRLLQGRNMLHRITARTVVIGDIPWVAQCADAFLSKLFAVSYSIAGITVMNGNPADHFVHRLTHRVVRGTLLICGRPDGRLSALSTAEASACLAVNQASSIQSLGGTCESITIGHNPFTLPLSSKGIFLKRKRPMFLCERLLTEQDAIQESIHQLSMRQESSASDDNPPPKSKTTRFFGRRSRWSYTVDTSLSRHADSSIRPRVHTKRSAAALLGAYMNFEQIKDSKKGDLTVEEESEEMEDIIDSAIKERKWNDRARKLYHAFDIDGDGFLSEEDFIAASYKLQAGLSEDQLSKFFKIVEDSDGHVDYDGFLQILQISNIETGVRLPSANKDERGLIQIEPSKERYFGEGLRKLNEGKGRDSVDFMLARSQHLAQELYETRIASLQRFVAMTVMFHQMGRRVEEFFEWISFGLLAYRMDRTHSIMRIATTASPVSGADVRQQMRRWQLLRKVQHSIRVISVAYLHYKDRKEKNRVRVLEQKASI